MHEAVVYKGCGTGANGNTRFTAAAAAGAYNKRLLVY